MSHLFPSASHINTPANTFDLMNRAFLRTKAADFPGTSMVAPAQTHFFKPPLLSADNREDSHGHHCFQFTTGPVS